MSRVGIIGGTFDPPHVAHLEMAKRAMEKIPLEKVLFMPAPAPPHKKADSGYETRVKMVELALGGLEGMELSRMEEFREGPSFTVDLLEYYVRTHGDDVYYIIGSDSMSELDSWKNPERILQLATLVVFRRTGYAFKVPVEGDASVVLFDEPVMDVSSSEIREKIAEGSDVSSYLPQSVLKFILDNSLYSC